MTPEMIAGRYVVDRAIGRGGMGTVWLCRDTVLGREVAVKQVGVLRGESVPDLARALREARSSAALNHRHVVSVFDAVEADDHIWLVMEYVPGETLAQVIAREGRLDPARVAAIGAQVADGLAAAHAQGTVHRDVKPGNVLLAGDVAKIGDFGIARTEGDEQLTRSGLLIGTPLYFSPELARGADPSPAGDVWALGITLYAALEGAPPVADRSNPIATLAAIAETRPPRPEHAAFLTDAIGRMLDPDPVSRWTMADAAQALRRLHEDHLTSATIATPVVDRTPPMPDLGQGTLATPRDDNPAAIVAAPALEASVVGARPPHERRARWPLVVAVLVLLFLSGIGTTLLIHDGDPGPGAGDNTASGSASSSPSASRSKTPSPTSSTPPPTGSRSAPTATTSATGPATVSAGSRGRTVADYYALLPEDTFSAWKMLSKPVQAEIGNYADYVAFWNTIEDVTVDAFSTTGDVVTVHLTYTSNRGQENETRQLQVERVDSNWLISDDLGPVRS